MLQNDLNAVLSEAQRGRYKATLKLARSGMKRHPSHPAFPNFAAVALCATQRQKEAVPYFRKALKLDPSFVDARRNLALALLTLGEFSQAERLLKKLVELTPRDSSAWHHLATVQLELDAPADALEASDRAVALAPHSPDILALRSTIKQRQGRIVAAIKDCKRALERAPGNADLWIRLSTLHMIRSDNDAALEAATQAVQLAPDHPPALRRLSEEHTASGHLEDAIRMLQLVIRTSPTGFDIEALARLQSADQNARLRALAEDLLKTARKGSEDRARIEFGLATMARQTKDFAAETRHLERANRALFQLAPYDAELETRRTQKLISRFAKPAAPVARQTAASPRPVFVVGLPRSGTTLTEAMLGAHPRVCPMGERSVTQPLYAVIDDNTPFDAEAFVQAEAAERTEMTAQQDVFTDKLPENYKMIGFLKQAYPDCRIIHVHRDPRDTALSMWRASFALGAVLYTCDQTAMAQHFNLYRQLMTHWHTVFPDEILDLSYQDLTRDPEAASRTLARHCGIEWTADMARPDQHVDKVRTYTAHQLRQPVHQKSVGGWQKHTGMLTEFIDGLDPDLWPEVDAKG